MFRNVTVAAAALAAVAVCQPPASAKRIAVVNHSTIQKTIQADAVVAGKVSEVEKDEVEVAPFAGATDKLKMRVAVVKVETALVGAKTVTHVKVLIPGAASEPPADPAAPGGAAGRPLTGRGGVGPVTLKGGDEGLYFLTKHPTAASYYVINPGFTPVDAKADTYKDEVAKVKAVLATVADPMAALKAEKAEDRLAAAATLIQKYRRGLPVEAKEVAIPAEETKAIFKALADADWAAPPKPGAAADYQSQPNSLLANLGLFPGAPNGLPQIQVKPNEDYNAKLHEAFKAWLAKDGGKFEIKKFVPKE